MLREIAMATIPAILVAVFGTWYTRYHSRNDKWRESVDAKIAQHDTQLAVQAAGWAQTIKRLDEIFQELRGLTSRIDSLITMRRE